MLDLREGGVPGSFLMPVGEEERVSIEEFSGQLRKSSVGSKAAKMATFFGQVVAEEQSFDCTTMSLIQGGEPGIRFELVDDGWEAEGLERLNQLMAAVCFLCWLESYATLTRPRLIISSVIEGLYEVRWAMSIHDRARIQGLRDQAIRLKGEVLDASAHSLAEMCTTTGAFANFSWPESVMRFESPCRQVMLYDRQSGVWYGLSLTEAQLAVAISYICYITRVE